MKKKGRQSPLKVLLALPVAFQDGVDKHDGVMRYIMEHGLDWDIHVDRMSPAWDRPHASEIPNADGAIVNGMSTLRLLKNYATSCIPRAAIDWRHSGLLDGRRKTVLISADGEEIGRVAADVVLKNGNFASVAFLPIDDCVEWSATRGKSFAARLAEHSIDTRVLSMHVPLERQLRSLPKPAAVFAANDAAAARVLAAAKNEGIPVPFDLSVLGVDNERLTCLHSRPPLASVQPNFEKAGYLAAAALHAMMSGRSIAVRQTYGVRKIVMRRSMEPPGQAGRLVQRARELIRDTRLASSGINAIAERLGVSRRLLDRRFRQIEGTSMLAAIQAVRVEEACKLLRTTSMSITEICSACSFGSGTSPMRLFKKQTGMTMRAYRLKTFCPQN